MESKFKFLTKTSFLKKIKNKSFIIGNIIVFIIIAALVNIDSVVNYFGGDFNDNYKIKVIDNANYYEDIKLSMKNVNEYIEKDIKVEKEKKELKEAKKDIKGTKDILLVVNKDEKNIFKVDFISDSYVDMLDYQSILSCLNASKSNIAVQKLNLNAEDLALMTNSVEINRLFIDESKTEEEENSKMSLSVMSLVIVLPCFMLIVFLVQMIGAEINEEKSTRGMEIIIGNVSSKTHFFSKVLASNLFVILQGILLFLYSGVGLLIRKITTTSKISETLSQNSDLNSVLVTIKNSGIIDKLGYALPLIIILILLSFLAYSLLAGILASMTTNMENFQQLQTPLMVISVIGYYLIIMSSMFPGATFMKVMSVIPLISISLAPSLFLSGQISVFVVIIAILILMLLNYILIKYGLRIYKVGILNYSESDLWKKMFKAVKEK